MLVKLNKNWLRNKLSQVEQQPAIMEQQPAIMEQQPAIVEQQPAI